MASEATQVAGLSNMHINTRVIEVAYLKSEAVRRLPMFLEITEISFISHNARKSYGPLPSCYYSVENAVPAAVVAASARLIRWTAWFVRALELRPGSLLSEWGMSRDWHCTKNTYMYINSV